jgi:RNA polymerase sigma-70 factor, ECF subfamily
LSDPTDEDLMARVQRRDQQAFRCLLDRHAGSLRNFLYRMNQNADDADELCQEAFLRVWQHAGRWESGRVQFNTWLFRIGQNLAIDRFRKQRETSLDDVPERGDDSDDPRRSLSRSQTEAHLRAAIAALPERQRTALVLCHFQGLSYQQAAAVLDVSLEALESLISRARRTLKQQLKPIVNDIEIAS